MKIDKIPFYLNINRTLTKNEIPKMSNIFGLLMPGHLPSFNGEIVDGEKVLFKTELNHNSNESYSNTFVLFMTGQTPVPDGMGGAVYVCLQEAANTGPR